MIYEEKNTLSEETCNDMISWFNNKITRGENVVIVSDEMRDDVSIPNCNRFESFTPFYDKLNSVIREHGKNYLKKLKTGQGHYKITGYKLQKSIEGGGFTMWHSELPIFSQKWEMLRERFATWTFYLNDTDTGYTDFYHQNLSIKPETGKLVIWPSYHTHRHRANPDLKEDKYIITGWLETDYERNRK